MGIIFNVLDFFQIKVKALEAHPPALNIKPKESGFYGIRRVQFHDLHNSYHCSLGRRLKVDLSSQYFHRASSIASDIMRVCLHFEQDCEPDFRHRIGERIDMMRLSLFYLMMHIVYAD